METAYVPGSCNIGTAETAMRRRAGRVGAALAVVLAVVLIAADADPRWRLLVALPAAMSAVGFLQARQRFCAAYGLRGVMGFSPKVGATEAVGSDDARRKDAAVAKRIMAQSLLIGLLAGIAAYLI